MKKWTSRSLVLLVIGGLLVSPGVAQADIVERTAHPIRKLGRGLANGLGGLLEVPITIQLVGFEKGPVAGLTLGLLLGAGKAVVRTLAGAVELVTFPFPFPNNYEPLLLPEFVLEPGSSPPPSSTYQSQ